MAAVASTTAESLACHQTSIEGGASDAPNQGKKKRKRPQPTAQTLTQLSMRKPQWSYIHLQHLSSNRSLDGVTAHLHITSALSSFLGLHGTAIPVDILKLEAQDVWIRAPAEDRSALIAAVGGWTNASGDGWRVKGWSHWSVSAPGWDAGQDLFED